MLQLFNYIYFLFQIKPHRFKSKDKDLLKYIMVTKLGCGPKCVDDHLLNNDGTLKSKIDVNQLNLQFLTDQDIF